MAVFLAMALLRLVAGLVLGAAFVVLARRARVLTRGGALGGGAFGVLLVTLGGWAWAVPAVVFFGGASLVSRVGGKQKANAARRAAKGSERDVAQVMANGGAAMVLLVAHALAATVAPDTRLPAACYLGFLGALAAAAADTWATEVGTLSPRRPRSIWTGEPVAPGTSGGVSVRGTLGAALGAASVALAAVGARAVAGGPAPDVGALALGAVVVGAGVAGAVADSLAGATVQVQYRDPITGGLTERKVGRAGAHRRVRGWPGVTNEVVNVLATVVGAAVAALSALV